MPRTARESSTLAATGANNKIDNHDGHGGHNEKQERKALTTANTAKGENLFRTFSIQAMTIQAMTAPFPRHSRESGNPVRGLRPEGPRIQRMRRCAPECTRWIPAFAGMTRVCGRYRIPACAGMAEMCKHGIPTRAGVTETCVRSIRKHSNGFSSFVMKKAVNHGVHGGCDEKHEILCSPCFFFSPRLSVFQVSCRARRVVAAGIGFPGVD
jgi:hypothetical protein